MKAKVFVALKKTVLDPQGKTILAALRDLGYQNIADVRQGKFFEILLPDDVAGEQAREQIERIARDVLTNPVIEEFSYSIE
jgi:phosphoribosylformylglycinamidine synthase PurS subunit